MVKFDKLSKTAKKYRFIADKQPSTIISHIKEKYERLAPVLEQFREMLEGERVSHTTIRFNSRIELDVAFGLVDQRMQAEFNTPYNEFVRSNIPTLLAAARTMMSVIYKSSFVSKKFNPEVIMGNEKLRMYYSSIFHWLFYNQYYEIAAGWFALFNPAEYPNVNNLPKTTKLIKKVVRLFEGMEEKAQLEGRFHDVLTSSASGQLESEKVYITIDFTELLQCSHHTASPWRSCYALNKQFPYSSFYMASHPDVGMIYTVDSRGLKTFRTWIMLHPHGFTVNKEAWPNGSTATNTKRDSIFNQIKGAFRASQEGNFVEDLNLISDSGRISTSHEVYKQFAQGGGRANMSYYKPSSDFFSRHESFYSTVPTHKYFKFTSGDHHHGSLERRSELTEAQVNQMLEIEAMLVKYRETGEYGPSQLVLMLQAMDPTALEFFKEGIRNQHGAEVFDAAYAEAFPDTVIPEVTVEEAVEEIVEERGQEEPPAPEAITPTPDPVMHDEDITVPTDGTTGQLTPECTISVNTMPRFDIAAHMRIDPDTGRSYVVEDEMHNLIALTPRRDFRVEGGTALHEALQTLIEENRFGGIELQVAGTVHDEVHYTTADVQATIRAYEEMTGINLDEEPVSEAVLPVEEEARLNGVFDEVYIDEAVEMEQEILNQTGGNDND